MGHGDIFVTLDTYTHIKSEDAIAEMERLDLLMEKEVYKNECLDLRRDSFNVIVCHETFCKPIVYAGLRKFIPLKFIGINFNKYANHPRKYALF